MHNTAQLQPKNTWVVILDEESLNYMAQAGEEDPNAFINRLLKAEMERRKYQRKTTPDSSLEALQNLMDSTPDTSK